MRFRFIIIFLFCVLTLQFLHLHAQSPSYDFNNVCQIELPNKLELQASELNTIKSTSTQQGKKIFKVSSPADRIVFQQTGLNNGVKSAFDLYCRVIIEHQKTSKYNPFYKYGENVVVDKDILLTVNELAEENCRMSGTPFIRLINVQPLKIKGFPVLYYSYKRKGWEGKKPPVIVNVYQIFNNLECVIVTFSYREAEKERWKDIHNNIIKTFNFNHRY